MNRVALSALAALIVGGGLCHAEGVRLVRDYTAVFEIRSMTADAIGSPSHTLKIDPRDGGRIEFEIDWGTPGKPVRVELAGYPISEATDPVHRIRFESRVIDSAGRSHRAQRAVEFEGEATTLFEVYREGDRPLTLVLRGSSEIQTRIPARSTPGKQVRFRLEIQRVEEGRVTPLETNWLNTFIGEAVSYSFHLGEQADKAEITLRPVRLTGDVAEIEVQLSGAFPREEGTDLTSRRENWVTTRGTATTLALEQGDPPTGYRFSISPHF